MPLQCVTGGHLTIPVSFFSPFNLGVPFHPSEFQFSSPLAVVNRLKNLGWDVFGWQTVALTHSDCQKPNLSPLGLCPVAGSALGKYKGLMHSP